VSVGFRKAGFVLVLPLLSSFLFPIFQQMPLQHSASYIPKRQGYPDMKEIAQCKTLDRFLKITYTLSMNYIQRAKYS